MGFDGTATSLVAIRLCSYGLLGYSLFYLAMSIGKW